MNQRGLTEVTVAIFLLAAAMSTLSCLALYSHFVNRVELKADLQEELGELEEKREALRKKQKEVVEPLGSGLFQVVNGKLPTSAVIEQVRERKRLYGGIYETDEVSNLLDSTRLYDNLYSILGLVLKRYIHVRARNTDLTENRDIIRQNINNFNSVLPQVAVSKTSLLKKIDLWRNELTRLLNEIDREYETENSRLSGMRDDLIEKIRTVTLNKKIENKTLTQKIQIAKSQLKDLLKSRELIRFVPRNVHGKIVHVNVKDKLGYVDIGSKNMVKEGIVFYISRPTSLGIFQMKGKVVVRHVWLESSEVEILEEFDEKEPIIEGDILINPFFNTERHLMIAFSGRNDIEGFTITKNEAIKKAIEIGCKIISPKKITLDNGDEFTYLPHYIDYLVYTGPDVTDPTHKPEYFTALELGIPVAFPEDVIQYLED